MKKFAAILCTLVLAFSLVACNRDNNIQNNTNTTASAPETTNKTEKTSGEQKTEEQKQEPTKEEKPNVQEDKKENWVSGEYVGQIDSNSVEIKVEGKAQSFALSDELKNLFEQKQPEEGSTIRFQFEARENAQNMLLKIEGLE